MEELIKEWARMVSEGCLDAGHEELDQEQFEEAGMSLDDILGNNRGRYSDLGPSSEERLARNAAAVSGMRDMPDQTVVKRWHNDDETKVAKEILQKFRVPAEKIMKMFLLPNHENVEFFFGKLDKSAYEASFTSALEYDKASSSFKVSDAPNGTVYVFNASKGGVVPSVEFDDDSSKNTPEYGFMYVATCSTDPKFSPKQMFSRLEVAAKNLGLKLLDGRMTFSGGIRAFFPLEKVQEPLTEEGDDSEKRIVDWQKKLLQMLEDSGDARYHAASALVDMCIWIDDDKVFDKLLEYAIRDPEMRNILVEVRRLFEEKKKMLQGNALDVLEAEADIGGDKYDDSSAYESGIRLWVDDIRESPPGFTWLKSVDSVISFLRKHGIESVSLFDLDHDAGDFHGMGGDYIKILDWLEMVEAENITVHIHSANPVGANNMRQIISRNKEKGWREVRNT